MKVQVRPIQVSDLEQVLDIERRSFPAPWSYEMLLRECSNAEWPPLVATVRQTVAGYLFATSVLDEVTVQTIAVDAAYRRHGIARTLFEVLLQKARGDEARTVLLEVRESNLPARNLYRKLGFTEVGLRRNYYRNPDDDALLLTLEL